tara:strand:- start:1256 stop:1705 length:450 start_codon:yes stop_codon:yes gene_type:complete
LNNLLLLNKKILLLFILFLFLLIFGFLFTKFYLTNTLVNYSKSNVNIGADIVEPRFSINNKSKKISVSANEGNFVNDQEILLKNNVMFKSKDFIIKSDNVVFDTIKLTAQSKDDSKFISDKTTISSKGFGITENGNIINFNGKSKLIIK